jgi:hypothetical protein
MIFKKYVSKLLYEKAVTRAIFTVWGIAIKEISVSFSQFFDWRNPLFSLWRVLKYIFLALFRLVLGRSVRISYGYTGEDRIIESLLQKKITENGFYVEVGCNEPRFISNTFLLYRRGWRGICIDANEKLVKKFSRIRPRDRAVAALVSDEETEFQFIEYTNPVLSSADTSQMEIYLAQGQKIINRNVKKASSLTHILNENQAPSHFDLLAIDAEEFDFQVLKSLDYQQYSPRLIMLEAEDFDPSQPTLHPVFQFLTGKGYILKGSILKNLYFMKA